MLCQMPEASIKCAIKASFELSGKCKNNPKVKEKRGKNKTPQWGKGQGRVKHILAFDSPHHFTLALDCGGQHGCRMPSQTGKAAKVWEAIRETGWMPAGRV